MNQFTADGLLELLERASTILRRARNVLRRNQGVTIIVHAAELKPGATGLAVVSTLPSRRHYRALLAEAVAQSVIADGIHDDAGEIAVRDYREIMQGRTN